MGAADLFAKAILADEVASLTAHAFAWLDPVEIALTEVRLDGLLTRLSDLDLASWPAPWSLADALVEIVVELKMAGDHTDRPAFDRARLRRFARQVHHLQRTDNRWPHQVALWVVAGHVPGWLAALGPVRRAPGCYQVSVGDWQCLWVASNELPLDERLIPLLLTRSGEALFAFGQWVVGRRSGEWVLRMLEFTAMTEAQKESLFEQLDRVADPEVGRRRAWLAAALTKRVAAQTPELVGELVRELSTEQRLAGLPVALTAAGGRLDEARKAVGRVLSRRGLAVTSEQQVRLDGCDDLATLERWLDQAITAASADEALG